MCDIVVVFRDEAWIFFHAAGVGTFAEPVLVTWVAAILAQHQEAAFPRFVSALPAPLAVGMYGCCLFLPGIVPNVKSLLDVGSHEGRTWPLVVDDAWCYALEGIGGS